MSQALVYRIAADLLLLGHVLFVFFVMLGLVLILAGGCLGWRWVRNPWFRTVHLLAIAVVVLQSWLGMICPLTIWEMSLRQSAGDTTYQGAFVAHWLETLLYYQAPAWVFVLVYTLFGAIVATTWYWVRPRPLGRGRD